MTNKTTATVQDKKRNFETFREQAIYLIDIQVRCGVTSRKLEWEFTGLSDQARQSYEKQGIKAGSVPVFKSLRKKYNKLEARKKKIQRIYLVYAEPYWFFREEDLETVAQELEHLQQLSNDLKKEIKTDYQAEKEAYWRSLEQTFNNADLPPSEAEKASKYYFSFFPSLEEALDKFGVEISNFMRVPSLVEQAQEEARLAESETKRQEQIALQNLQRQFVGNLREKVSTAVQSATDDAYGIIAESLEKIECKGNKEFTRKQQQTLQEYVERLQRLATFNSDLEGLAESLDTIVSFGKNADQREQMKKQVESLKSRFTGELEILQNSEGKGHKALADWLIA
ncbi:UNVERIFIED_CONTAM: hypothetical protein BEN50_17060 [Euhalothece sp. KZN 001]